MKTAMAPIALSCGDPAGIGPEIAIKAWAQLRAETPFVWIGDPRHLPNGSAYQVIDDVADAANICEKAMPVLAQPFASPVTSGGLEPENAQGVIDAIVKAFFSTPFDDLISIPVS